MQMKVADWVRQSMSNSRMHRSMKSASCVRNSIRLWDKTKKNSIGFQVWEDRSLFEIKGVPMIELEGDNDEDSTWEQVEEHCRGMSMALSLATYDRAYGK